MADIIHGATGAQGSPVLSALTSAGRSVVAAVRHPEAVPDGIAVRQVDLASVDSLASTYEGADGVFVGSGIFKSGDPAARAAAIVRATAAYDDPAVIAEVSRGLGEAMVGINVADVPAPHRLAERGW